TLERGDVAVLRLFGREHDDLARAVGKRAEQQVHADRRGVKAFERDYARRQSLTVTRMAQHFGPALPRVVEQDAGVGTARFTVGREQRLQPHAHVRHARIDMAHRTRRADRGAAAATRAQMRLDLDVIAVGLDRAARADVDALVAAFAPGAAVRADARVVGEEARLLELADQRAELLRRQRLLERIIPRREVALRRQRDADQRLA